MSARMNLLSKLSAFTVGRRLSTSAISQQKVQSNEKLVKIEVNDRTGYGTLSLNRPPANSLNAELIKSLSAALDEMKSNKSRGVILTSTSSKIFSAGLDISDLYSTDSKRLTELWSAALDCWLKMFEASFPITAAINGHAIAGGCFYTMACDYRVMVDGYKIGLNEIQVGVVPPKLLMILMSKLLPKRRAEISLIQGITYSTQEAMKINLIDEIVADTNEAISKCEAYLNRISKIQIDAWCTTKRSFRKEEIDYIKNFRDQDIQEFVKSVLNDEAQSAIKMYYEGLKNKN